MPETNDIGQDEGYTTNLKRIVDDYANHTLRRGDREQELADQLNQQFLRYVDDQHSLVMRMAGNAATIDHVVNAGAASQVTEFRGIGAQVAQEAAEAATAAVNAAMGNVTQGGGVATASIMAQIADGITNIQEALSVLLAREVGSGG